MPTRPPPKKVLELSLNGLNEVEDEEDEEDGVLSEVHFSPSDRPFCSSAHHTEQAVLAAENLRPGGHILLTSILLSRKPIATRKMHWVIWLEPSMQISRICPLQVLKTSVE
jgi:hypothetical protein